MSIAIIVADGDTETRAYLFPSLSAANDWKAVNSSLLASADSWCIILPPGGMPASGKAWCVAMRATDSEYMSVNVFGTLQDAEKGMKPGAKIVQAECVKCKDWGRTITKAENDCAIPCPVCGRLTWPNLGVNCPAGMGWALSNARAVQHLRDSLPPCPPLNLHTAEAFQYMQPRKEEGNDAVSEADG